MRKPTIILLLIALPVIAIIVLLVLSQLNTVTPPKTVSLSVWGILPASEVESALQSYQGQQRYVKLVYTQVASEGLKNKAVEAWALGAGPDILMVPADELKDFASYLAPAPATTPSYLYKTVKRFGIKNELQITKVTTPGPTATTMRRDFVDTATQDLIIDNAIYGLPIYMDTMVLFSNRALLNQARIPLPATTWDEFVQQVPRMTLLDSEGKIIQSGAAIGTAKNITYADDILGLLILQNGGSLVSPTNPTQSNLTAAESKQAIEFYTDFARQQKIVYTWNADQEEALNSFAAGKVGYFFGFRSDEEIIQQRGTALQYDITAVPQISPQQSINLANYYPLTVAKRSAHTDVAWNVVQYLASKNGNTQFINASGLIPARKDTLQEILSSTTDATIQALAGQALTASLWYRGTNQQSISQIMAELIDAISVTGTSTEDAAKNAAEQMRIILRNQ